jgi:hypothetical protein
MSKFSSHLNTFSVSNRAVRLIYIACKQKLETIMKTSLITGL